MAFYQDIYDTLSHETKLCIKRTRWRFGKAYSWTPKQNLVRRVSHDFKISEEEALDRLLQIKYHVQAYPHYF